MGTALASVTLPHAAAASTPVVDLPRVEAKAETITLHGRPKLLVRSLTVFHAHEVDVLATCRKCLRLQSPESRKLHPGRGITRFAGVNWILSPGLHVRLYVTAAGAIGRYLMLGPARPLARGKLVVEGKGCLDHGQRVSCAAQAPDSPPAPDAAITYPETVGGNTETWTDYRSAGGLGGALIEAGRTVDVACAVRGFVVEDGNPWWYRIASSPWNGAYYASADPFYNNGRTSGSLADTPFVDPAVPTCAT
jgi:hypothetical protein